VHGEHSGDQNKNQNNKWQPAFQNTKL
jgi:hypothetical protein